MSLLRRLRTPGDEADKGLSAADVAAAAHSGPGQGPIAKTVMHLIDRQRRAIHICRCWAEQEADDASLRHNRRTLARNIRACTTFWF